jgi:hypothetical protein
MSSNQQGQLRIEVIDVNDKRVGGRTDVRLRHQVLSHSLVRNGLDSSKKILIKELFGAPQGLYMVMVDPAAYLPVSQFINIKASGITDLQVKVPIDPDKVGNVKFPDYVKLLPDLQTTLERSDKVLTLEGKKGEQLYNDVDKMRKACLLNIAAKCAHTPFSNGRTVLSYIDRISELRGERFFAVVSKELREETKNSVSEGLFRTVSGALHAPPQGFSDAGSFKTMDKYGNLQLTFFAKGDEWVADIDIDDAAGIEHVFQVLDHKITGSHTNPYHIHEILIARQKIDPGYSFET